jgi:hypothetical protein
MKEFRFVAKERDAKSIKEEKTILWFGGISLIISIFSILFLNLISDDFTRWFVIISIVFIAIIVFIFIYGIKMSKKLLNSYVLTIDEEGTITREQKDTPTVTIQKQDISEIIKRKDGGFVIRSTDWETFFHIPSEVEKPLELEETLNLIHPIVYRSGLTVLQKWVIVGLVITGFISFEFYQSKDKSIILASGLLLEVMFIGLMVLNYRSKNHDKNSKRVIVFSLLLQIYVITRHLFDLITI